MRYMLIMQVEPEAAARAAEELDMEQIIAAMGAYNEELQKAGVFLSAEGLSDASEGFRVDFSSTPPGRHRRTVRRGSRGLHGLLDPRGLGSRRGRGLGAQVPARSRDRARGAPRQRDLATSTCPATTSGSPRSRSGAPPTRDVRPRHAPSHPSGGACSRRRAGARRRASAADTRGRSGAAPGSVARRSVASRRSRRCSRRAA